jgi:hypothetical protein
LIIIDKIYNLITINFNQLSFLWTIAHSYIRDLTELYVFGCTIRPFQPNICKVNPKFPKNILIKKFIIVSFNRFYYYYIIIVLFTYTVEHKSL